MTDQTMEIKCPVCGADCPPEAKFCRNCGTKLEQKEFCKSCGAELRPGGKFCRNCGASVNDTETIFENFANASEMPQKNSANAPETPWENSTNDTETILEKDSQADHSSGGSGKPEKGVVITRRPAMFAVGAAVILLIAAAVFIIGNMSSGEEDIAEQPEVQENSVDQTAQDEQEDLAEPEEEVDMSLVDIDAVSNAYVELSGLVVSDGYNLFLHMDEALNFYVFDPIQSKNILVQGVDQAYIDEYNRVSVSDYEERAVTVGGKVRYDNGNIVFQISNIVSAEPEQDDSGIHQYQIVVEDCTWYDALSRSSDQGGYLARISSPEEYLYIVDMLNSGGYTNIHFYLGGRRDDTGVDYYWVNEQNEFMGDCLNNSASWCSSYWYQNEPSFRDTGSDAHGEIVENVMNLFCVSGSWYLNDSSDNLAGNYPDLLSGKVGYIIEYEE